MLSSHLIVPKKSRTTALKQSVFRNKLFGKYITISAIFAHLHLSTPATLFRHREFPTLQTGQKSANCPIRFPATPPINKTTTASLFPAAVAQSHKFVTQNSFTSSGPLKTFPRAAKRGNISHLASVINKYRSVRFSPRSFCRFWIAETYCCQVFRNGWKPSVTWASPRLFPGGASAFI